MRALEVEEICMDRVKTGIEGLDELLYGGFLRGDAILVCGAPGTGKTSLGMQFLYNGITHYQEPGIYITFEEFPQRIYRDAASFGWDFRHLEETGKLKVLFTSPEVLQQDIVRDHGLVSEMINEIGARRVVVDSISHFHVLGTDAREIREAIYGVINALKREALSAILVRELREQEEIGAGMEEFIADGVIKLMRSPVNGQNMYFIEVVKSRGSAHVPIPSLFFFTGSGIKVIPPFQHPFYRFEQAVSTGIPQLDDLLGGGIPQGSFYLLEIDDELHQDILDVAFAKEALDSGDIYIRMGDSRDIKSRWGALLKEAGMDEIFKHAMESGKARTLWPQRENGASKEKITPESFGKQLDQACSMIKEKPTRFQVDLSGIFTLMVDGYSAFTNLAARCQGTSAVILGTVSPNSIPADQRAKLHAAADGIVRIWSEGTYAYLQVIKTVNSARTRVHVINQISTPPFLEIIA